MSLGQNPSEKYIPVSCALHSELELAIMHKSVLSLEWFALESDKHKADVVPLDMRVSNGEEYLVARPVDVNEGTGTVQIRLDRILFIETKN